MAKTMLILGIFDERKDWKEMLRKWCPSNEDVNLAFYSKLKKDTHWLYHSLTQRSNYGSMLPLQV